MTKALEEKWTDELDLEHPHDRVMAELERVIGARFELRLSDPPRGRILAHCKHVQGLISGYMDVRVGRRSGRTLVRLMARPYSIVKGTPGTFGDIRREVLEDIKAGLEGKGPQGGVSKVTEAPPVVPPRRLICPDPWPALKWTLISAMCLTVIVVVFSVIVVVFSVPYLDTGLRYLWPYYLLFIPPPFISALLIRSGYLRSARYLLDGSGFPTIMILIFLTYGVAYALVLPMSIASQLIHETWFWRKLHNEMEAMSPHMVLGMPAG